MLETQLKLHNSKRSCLRTHTHTHLNESCWFYHNSTTASVVLLCRRLQQRSRRSTNSLWRLPQWWWLWWRLPWRLKIRWFPQQAWRLLTLRLRPMDWSGTKACPGVVSLATAGLLLMVVRCWRCFRLRLSCPPADCTMYERSAHFWTTSAGSFQPFCPSHLTKTESPGWNSGRGRTPWGFCFCLNAASRSLNVSWLRIRGVRVPGREGSVVRSRLPNASSAGLAPKSRIGVER